MCDNWKDVQCGLSALPEADKTTVREYFNSIDEDYDTIGDDLFGEDPGDFRATIGRLDED